VRFWTFGVLVTSTEHPPSQVKFWSKTNIHNGSEIAVPITIRPVTFPLAALREAVDAAAKASNLECIVVQP
jgi:hypothetical protein